MTYKKIMKGIMKDSASLIGANVTMGVGGSVIHAAGGNAQVMSSLSRFQPVTGTIVGGGHALKMLKGFGK